MRIDLVTKEYPPAIYGGAGVHVAELVAALRASIEVKVHCFGEPRAEVDVEAYAVPVDLADANPVLQTLAVNVAMTAGCSGSSLIHTHTWYANEVGRLGKRLTGARHVLTAHSLEPLRPWKKEQLGGGYNVSSDIERHAYESADAIIAVSAGMRADILRSYPEVDHDRVHVIHNGIDTHKWQARKDSELLARLGIAENVPTVVFVGRITRQKGITYLLKALENLSPEVQVILCAGAPDTPELAAEVSSGVECLQRVRSNVIWIPEHLSTPDLCAVLSSATVFVCPSIYEPLGIVNLEAMACGVPVVGTATGGIPEVVIDGVTGWLVPIDQVQDGTGTPLDASRFIRDLSNALNEAVSDPVRAAAFGEASRQRARDHFSWPSIAEKTIAIYERVLAG